MKYIFITALLFNAATLFSQHTTVYVLPENITKVMDAYPQLSPDASKIVFQSNRMGNWDIFIADTNGTNIKQLTSDSLNEVTPKWSPDGKQIVYCIDVDTVNSDIYLMDADGTNKKAAYHFSRR